MFLEDKAFEIGIAKLLFLFRSIPLNHPDGFKNEHYNEYNYKLCEHKASTFGVLRSKTRIHVARDLYYEVDEPIYAIYDGIVKNVYPFYYDTWAIEIEHDYEYKSGYKLYVRYGEVSKNDILVKKGDSVIRGQQIAKIGLLYNSKKKRYVIQPKKSGDKRGMLHIEMYTGESTGKLSDKTVKYNEMMYTKSGKYIEDVSFQRRKNL